MSNSADRLFRYILDRARREEMPLRISLYEDAAKVLSSEAHAPLLMEMARRLRAVEVRQRKMRNAAKKWTAAAERIADSLAISPDGDV